MSSNLAKQGRYIGATSTELAQMTTADKLAGGVSQKALFHRRGEITLYDDRLVLTQWSDEKDLVLERGDITSVDREFTELYGRLIGGLLNAGKPLILGTTKAGKIYLLIDRKEFMETNADHKWEKLIKDWLGSVA